MFHINTHRQKPLWNHTLSVWFSTHKKIILCMLIAISLILQTMGVASAAELSQSKTGDFEISFLSEVPNVDLSGIEIDVYSAQVTFTDNATGYVEYD